MTSGRGGVVNPVTASGIILAAATSSGVPLLAATHPEGIGGWLVPFPRSLALVASFLFPATTQAFCDEILEHIPWIPSGIQRAAAELPPALFTAVLVVSDVLLVTGGGAFAIARIATYTPICALLAAPAMYAALARRAKRRQLDPL